MSQQDDTPFGVLRQYEHAALALDMAAALAVAAAEPWWVKALCFLSIRRSSYLPLTVGAFCSVVLYAVGQVVGLHPPANADLALGCLWVVAFASVNAFADYRQRRRASRSAMRA
jgi:predicted neutral ceramidase superfamily lipid hydrolase